MNRLLKIIGYILYTALFFVYPCYELGIDDDGFTLAGIIKFAVNFFISFIVVTLITWYVLGFYYACKGEKEMKQGCLYPTIAMFVFIVVVMSFAFYKGRFKKAERLASENDRKEQAVYVCTGPSAKKYHRYRTYQWLENCSDTIEEMTLEKAEKTGKRPCRYCY